MSSQVRILFPPLRPPKVDKSGSSSVGRAIAFQAIGREFEPRFPLSVELSAIGRKYSGQEPVADMPL